MVAGSTASNEELTAQIVSINETVRVLTTRPGLAEQDIIHGRDGTRGSCAGAGGARGDDKRLYLDGPTGKTSFKAFAEDLLDWLEGRNGDQHSAALRAMDKNEEVDNYSDTKLSKKYYRLLKRLVRGHQEAKQVVKNATASNFLEALRKGSAQVRPPHHRKKKLTESTLRSADCWCPVCGKTGRRGNGGGGIVGPCVGMLGGFACGSMLARDDKQPKDPVSEMIVRNKQLAEDSQQHCRCNEQIPTLSLLVCRDSATNESHVSIKA